MTTGQNPSEHQVVSLGEVRSHRAYRRLLTELEAFCQELPDEEPWSVDQFFGPDASAEELEVLHLPFLDWLIFDYRSWEDGRGVLERFAESAKLDNTQREMLLAWRGARMGLYHVQTIFGDACLLEDCFTGAETPVQIDKGIDPFTQGDLVICRILPVGDSYHLGFDVRTTGAGPLPIVKEAIGRELAHLRRQLPDATWDDLFAMRWPLCHDAMSTALAAGCARPVPQWSTPPSLGPAGVGQRTNQLQCDVADALMAFEKDDDVSYADRRRGQQLWYDAVAVLQPAVGAVDGWAAGAAYAHLHYALADGTTQTEIAQAFGVSVTTLSMRARAIVQALQLEELDDRYADPFDPRVRYRQEPEPMAMVQTAAAQAIRLSQEARELVDRADWAGASAKFAEALAASPDSPEARNNLALAQYMDRKPKEATFTALPVLQHYPENVFTLALLGQCYLALNDRKQAAAYAEQAKASYHRSGSGNEKRMADQHRLVELLGQLEDDEGILAAITPDKPEQLDALTLRRGAVALARADRRLEAIEMLHAAQEKGAPLHLVVPLMGALELMEAKRIPPFKLDYEERLSSLMGWEWHLTSLTKSQLVCGIFWNKAKEAIQAVKAVGAQRDPWAPKLLRHLAKLDDLPKTVKDAILKALLNYR